VLTRAATERRRRQNDHRICCPASGAVKSERFSTVYFLLIKFITTVTNE
jgi:hypothetical protein